MEEPSNDHLLREIYRLTRENNEMMHRQRRSAFFWGFIKFVVYAALLAAPIWFYPTGSGSRASAASVLISSSIPIRARLAR